MALSRLGYAGVHLFKCTGLRYAGPTVKQCVTQGAATNLLIMYGISTSKLVLVNDAKIIHFLSLSQSGFPQIAWTLVPAHPL